MFKHVLVPLDYSDLSEKAIPYALNLVPQDGKITLLIVVENINTILAYATANPAIYTAPQDVIDQEELQKHAEDYLAKLASELPQPTPTLEQVVQVGNPPDTIVDFAESSGVEAIVMSTHGRTGLSRWLIGSVTSKVLSASPCPVLVIPGREVE